MVIFPFSVFDQKCLFWANLVQKVKIISLGWNLIPQLIRICRIQRWCSLFSFSIKNILFGQIWSEMWKLSVLRLNLVASLIRVCRIQWCCSLSFVSDQKYLFWANLVQKFKILNGIKMRVFFGKKHCKKVLMSSW